MGWFKKEKKKKTLQAFYQHEDTGDSVNIEQIKRDVFLVISRFEGRLSTTKMDGCEVAWFCNSLRNNGYKCTHYGYRLNGNI